VALTKKLATKPRESVAVFVPGSAGLGAISALVEGAIVGTRGPDLRKTEKSKHPFGTLTMVPAAGTDLAFEPAVERGSIVGEAINLARVLGVAAGSEEPPAFVILEHRHGGEGPTLALVGKGVTFDSGGLSLKPSASMEDMKSDMTGAAVVLSAMTAIARLGLKANVVGYMAITENMVNGRATLTGACLVALGTKIAGLFSNDDAFASRVATAAKATGERTWRLPLDDDFFELIKSSVADIKNVGGKWGGSITAAKFLQQFVDDCPWVHLDIAGPSWADAESGTRDSGGTGCFVRTLVRLVEDSTTI
jgi:leucyl aminopeptidase